ncbi:rod shape-determining protein [Qingrenia yutianensis]|uniref:rod shape-determining protein n=1 Tax=Qingrenia yutianensis TaxID=2763676 RepID=UPI00223BE702|nr:rod shape-determining protein [Qingrenia yutianensis]
MFKTFELSVDLGSSALRVFVKNQGKVFDEANLIAVEEGSGRLIAIGDRAKSMLGRENKKIKVVKPVKNGIIADFDACGLILKYIIDKFCKGTMIRPYLTIGISPLSSQIDQHLLMEAALSAGAKKVFLLKKPVAAALGNGINVTNASGRLIVDIGSDSTNIGLVSLGTVVSNTAIDIGGANYDRKIIEYLKKRHSLLIGEITAERVKMMIGGVLKREETEYFEVKGKNMKKGLPAVKRISSREISRLFLDDVKKIIEAIFDVVSNTPQELESDVKRYGIILTGGGSLVYGVKTLIENTLKLKVTMSDEPLESSIIGLSKATEQRVSLDKLGII